MKLICDMPGRMNEPKERPVVLFLAVLLCGLSAPVAGEDSAVAGDAEEVKSAFAGTEEDCSTPDGQEEVAAVPVDFRKVLVESGYRFTPVVLGAYVAAQKQQALADLRKMGKAIPAEFLAWVDGDGVACSTVYGSPKPVNVLLMLYSLSLDVGRPRFEKYRNWLLAAAVQHAHQGPAADLSPRHPLARLEIPGDPRVPVNTRDPNRLLDQNDHVINFLEDNKLVASDVMYHADWQEKFNACMDAKGQPARVHCSMKLGVGTPKEKKPALEKVMAAYRLFQSAYEAKGRIPAAKDPRVGLVSWLVFQIQNHETGQSRSGFPLDTAPWPVLTALLDPRLSLREADAINRRGDDQIPPRDRYTLNAATTEMLKAVDVRPFPFAEGSWWMIKKHGGACGTRAMLAANQNKAFGLPSAPVGEIGHASWVEFAYFKKGDRFGMRFEGGGHNPATLSVHQALPITRGRAQEKASNWGAFLEAIQGKGRVQSYMESMMAYYTIQSLTPEERALHGAQLEADALAINPGNLLLSGALERNAAESVADRKKERRRKQHAGELLRQQRTGGKQ